MNTKEKIILATLELAAQHGLGSVSMSQIAEKLGIRKPSLYNHFESKDAIIEEMYHYLRERSRSQLSPAAVDLGELVKDRTAEEVLMFTVSNYNKLNEQPEMMNFYKVIYSQRSIDATAAGIMLGTSTRLPFSSCQLTISVREKHSPVPMALPTVRATASSTSTSGSSQAMTVTISRLRPTPA